ncbi:hypothetical protein AA0313_1818 [Acetobacter indonesiensis NRIC 0313]|nr:hypothetical protein AA0313_1818 [Acetobacter indonesiensis NRIC 0313]
MFGTQGNSFCTLLGVCWSQNRCAATVIQQAPVCAEGIRIACICQETGGAEQGQESIMQGGWQRCIRHEKQTLVVKTEGVYVGCALLPA